MTTYSGKIANFTIYEFLEVPFIDITDDWDYRRLLEVCEILSPELLKWAITLGKTSADPDILEAAEDFTERAQAKGKVK